MNPFTSKVVTADPGVIAIVFLVQADTVDPESRSYTDCV